MSSTGGSSTSSRAASRSSRPRATSSAERVDVAIVGAGQAGLATSWHLKQAGVDHVLLEAGRVAETWRTRRWDSFCLVTPNWTVQLPGGAYAGADPDGYMPLHELIAFFESWTASFHPPVLQDSLVSSLEADPTGGFDLEVSGRRLSARTVVVASGAYQRAHRPLGGAALPRSVHQILAEKYRNPDGLPPGNVLVIGSGQTGCQLAEELHEAGRKVFVACGRCPWGPRRMDGRDIVWWAFESGFFDRTPDKLPSPAARLISNIVTTGHGGGHDLHLRTLHAMGVELLGRFTGAQGDEIHFADDLAASAAFGDARLADLLRHVNAYCATSGTVPPRFEAPPPLRLDTRTQLHVARDGIGSVIWTSGYRPDYGWIRLPVFDDMGFPVQTDGSTNVPGLYFVGVHYLRKAKSSLLYGVGEDAQIVAQQIVARRA